jgi:ABC-type transport system substrate-binding protein
MNLKNEKLDVTVNLGNSSLIKLQKLDYFNENYYSEYLDEYAYAYIGLNMKPESVNRKPFFVDQRVRRAMALLTPVDEIIEVLNYGRGLRQVSNVSPLRREYNSDLEPIPFDIDQATILLEEAGWKDTDGNNIRDKVINGEKIQFSFDLNYFGNSQLSKEMALMVKEEMYKAGIEVNTQPMDFNLLYKSAYEHQFDAMFGVWGGSAAPSDPTQLWHTSSWVNKGSNFFGFGDAKSDSLIELANRTVIETDRDEILKKFQAKIYEDQPYIFLYSRVRPTVIHKRFANAGMYNEKPGLITNNLKLKEEFINSTSRMTVQDI